MKGMKLKCMFFYRELKSFKTSSLSVTDYERCKGRRRSV